MLEIRNQSDLTENHIKRKAAGYQRLSFNWLWLLMAVSKLSSIQSITIIDYQTVIELWYKYGLSVSFLTISKHKKPTMKSKYKHYF